jgi:hypothetical protein
MSRYANYKKPIVDDTHSYSVTYGGSTSNLITHNLGSKDVDVFIYRMADDIQVYPAVERTTIDTVTITHGIAPGLGEFRAVVVIVGA